MKTYTIKQPIFKLREQEEMLTNHYNPKEFYEIILKTGLTTGVTRWKSNTN